MNGIYSLKTIEKIKNLKKIFQKIAVWILIGGIALGALLIIVMGADAWNAIGKTMGTLLILALALVISSNNFRRIEDGEKNVQIFATIGLISNVSWALLWILAFWGVYPIISAVEIPCKSYSSYYSSNLCMHENLTILGCIACIASCVSAFGLLASNIMSIREYNRKSVILPLKITATACLVYETIFGIIMLILSANDFDGSKLDIRWIYLATFAGAICLIVAIVAIVFSQNAKKNTDITVQPKKAQTASAAEEPIVKKLFSKNAKKNADITVQPKKAQTASAAEEPIAKKPQEDPEAKMRAEIEARVRAEMMEKEIRAKVQAEYDANSTQNETKDQN